MKKELTETLSQFNSEEKRLDYLIYELNKTRNELEEKNKEYDQLKGLHLITVKYFKEIKSLHILKKYPNVSVKLLELSRLLNI